MGGWGGGYFCHGLVTPDVGYGWVDGCSQPAITHICYIKDVGKGMGKIFNHDIMYIHCFSRLFTVSEAKCYETVISKINILWVVRHGNTFVYY